MQLTRESSLRLRAWCSLTGTILRLVGLLKTPAGKIKPFDVSKAITSDRVMTEQQLDLEEGELLSISVIATAGALRRGECFVEVYLCAFGADATGIKAVLISDYVWANHVLGWPGGQHHDSIEGPGKIIRISVTDPAAGLDFSSSVPTNALYRIRSVVFTLITDATAINRTVSLGVFLSTLPMMLWNANFTQGASLNYTYFFVPEASNILAGTNGVVPISQDLKVYQALILQSLVSNLQAGDAISAISIIAETWIEE